MTVTVIQRVCVLVAAVIAVGASVLQATGILGLTPAEFAEPMAVFVAQRDHRPEAAWFALVCAGLLTTVGLTRSMMHPARSARSARSDRVRA